MPCQSARELWQARVGRLLPGASGALPPAGVDEAGRGWRAGPGVAAAVILPEVVDLPGLTDSKALSAAQRAGLAPRIRACAEAWGLGVVWPGRIDEINILQATFEAMARAVRVLSVTPGMIFVDGNRTLPEPVARASWRRYGFERHKGYGTRAHYEALRRLGPCPQHRLTYRGVVEREDAPPAQGSLL